MDQSVKPRELKARRYTDIHGVFLVIRFFDTIHKVSFFPEPSWWSNKILPPPSKNSGKPGQGEEYFTEYFFKPDLAVGHSSTCMAHGLRDLQDEEPTLMWKGT